MRIKVKDTRGYVVRDALVFFRSTPLVTRNAQDQRTGQDGWLQLTVTPEQDFPELRPAYAVQFFVKAYRQGDPPLAGVGRLPARPGPARLTPLAPGAPCRQRGASEPPDVRGFGRHPISDSQEAVMTPSPARVARPRAAHLVLVAIAAAAIAAGVASGARRSRADEHVRADDHGRRAHRQHPSGLAGHLEPPRASPSPTAGSGATRRAATTRPTRRAPRSTARHGRRTPSCPPTSASASASACPRATRAGQPRRRAPRRRSSRRRAASPRARRRRRSRAARSSGRSSSAHRAHGWATPDHVQLPVAALRSGGQCVQPDRRQDEVRVHACRQRRREDAPPQGGRQEQPRQAPTRSRRRPDAGAGQPEQRGDHAAERREVGRRKGRPEGPAPGRRPGDVLAEPGHLRERDDQASGSR